MRISRDTMYMEMARTVARRGTCPRQCVGALAVSDDRQLWIGYNGSPAGEDHCIDVGCNLVNGACVRTDHAEVNALRQIPVDVSGSRVTLYTTHSPCQRCAETIADRGIRRVYFETPYRDLNPVQYLIAHGVKVARLIPNGFSFDIEGTVEA